MFLNEYQVRVVYPMPYEKYLSWIEPETGDITSRRKSPKRCSVYDAMFELYKIKAFLKNQNLKVTLLLIDMEEYKLLNGWSYDKKRGSVRYDRIPVGIRKIVELDCPQDYMQFVPEGLEKNFTSADFANAAHIDSRLLPVYLQCLITWNRLKESERQAMPIYMILKNIIEWR